MRGKNHTRRGDVLLRGRKQYKNSPPAGCGTTFELHWKAVELIWRPHLVGCRQSPFKLFEWVAASIFPPGIPGKSKAVAKHFQASPAGER